MEDTIQFIGKHGNWVVVKKTKPHENSPLENALFLSGILDTIYDRLEDYLHESFDLGPLDATVDEIVKGKRASANLIGEVVSAVNGPKVNRVINDLLQNLDDSFQKKEREAIKTLLKAYALRRAFKALKLKVDYSIASEEMKKGLKKFKGKGR